MGQKSSKLGIDAASFAAHLNYSAKLDLSNALTVNHTSLMFNEVDAIPDWSFAGAFASNRPLPSSARQADLFLYPTIATQDRTDDIQRAIDRLSRRGGGVLELAAGNYLLNSTKTLLFHSSNVTIRGSLPFDAFSPPETILKVAGTSRDIFSFGPEDIAEPIYSKESISSISEDHVPTGRRYVKVEDASVFSVNQDIEIQRTISAEWVKALKMNRLYRDGERQTWIPIGNLYIQQRRITSIDLEDNLIGFNFPLTDSLNNTLGADGKVVAFEPPSGRTSGCGVENLSVFLLQDQSGLPIDDEDRFNAVASFHPFSQDNWMRRMFLQGFGSFVQIDKRAFRITLQDVIMSRLSPTDPSAGFPADISINGAQVLVHRCATIGVPGSNSFSVVTGSLVPGPNVVLQHSTMRVEHSLEPHARWATGFLADSSFVGAMTIRNRGTLGSGQGWSSSQSMIYNTMTIGDTFIESPPLSPNLAIGSIGKIDPYSSVNNFLSQQAHVKPLSLFQAQLEDRIGIDLAAQILLPPATAIPRPRSTRSNIPFDQFSSASGIHTSPLLGISFSLIALFAHVVLCNHN